MTSSELGDKFCNFTEKGDGTATSPLQDLIQIDDASIITVFVFVIASFLSIIIGIAFIFAGCFVLEMRQRGDICVCVC